VPAGQIHSSILVSRPSLAPEEKAGGDDRDRTDNPRLAKAVLSQLSYIPVYPFAATESVTLVGLGRVELPTSSLSGTRSNQLSYKPRRLSFRPPSAELEHRVLRPPSGRE
jgi:hypothetical protein